MRFRMPFLQALARQRNLVRAVIGLSIFYDTHGGFETPGPVGKARHYRCSRKDCQGIWAYAKPPTYIECPHKKPMEACEGKGRKCQHKPPPSYQ